MEDEGWVSPSREGSTDQTDLKYEKKDLLKPLKHGNDVCRLNVESEKSETVKGISLDDIIAIRNIRGAPKQNKNSNGNIRPEALTGLLEEAELTLEEVIARRKNERFEGGTTKTNVGQSLEAIIQSNKKKGDENKTANGLDDDDGEEVEGGSSSGGRRYRGREDRKDGVDIVFIASPADVVMKLTESGLVIQYEVFKIGEGQNCREHNWRVKYTCGTVTVVAESSRKILAKEAAAQEFLKSLKDAESTLEIPPFKIPEACYYDPVICTRLEQLIASLSLDLRFEIVQTRLSRHDYFTTTYFVGEDAYEGNSFDVDYSKILAAVAAYDTFSGKKFHRDTYFVGDKCLKDKEFVCRETEATHILTLQTIPKTRQGASDGAGMRTHGKTKRRRAAEDEVAQEGEILRDDSGQMYVRSRDGSNKIRKLKKQSLDDLIEQKVEEKLGDLLEMANEELIEEAEVELAATATTVGGGGAIESDFEDEDDM